MATYKGAVFLLLLFPLLLHSKINAQNSQKDAPQWIYVTQSDDMKVYIQSEYISKEYRRIKVWTKWIYKQPYKYKGKIHQNFYYNHLAVWDLNDKQYKVIAAVNYAHDKYIDSYTPNLEEWIDVNPESVGESILEMIEKLFD